VRAICEALILEDDPAQLATLEAVARALFLTPVGARTPDRALQALGRHAQPVLALVDLDMSLVPEAHRTVDEVLERLYQQCGGCCVLVHSVRADEILERKRVERIHPLAMFAAKQDGLGALVDRVHRMLGVRFGDLAVRRGVTFHEPTGQTFGHRVAVSLLLGTATGQEVVLDDTETKAARRLKTWLRAVGSPVRLVDHGHRCYGLHVQRTA
jgi:CheY-like chemotaxis protein